MLLLLWGRFCSMNYISSRFTVVIKDSGWHTFPVSSCLAAESNLLFKEELQKIAVWLARAHCWLSSCQVSKHHKNIWVILVSSLTHIEIELKCGHRRAMILSDIFLISMKLNVENLDMLNLLAWRWRRKWILESTFVTLLALASFPMKKVS